MKLANLLKPWISSALPECDIIGLQNDSRLVKPGFLFIAYPGGLTDGRQYIQQAASLGAVAVLYESQAMPADIQLPQTIPCIPMPQLTTLLAPIASRFYHHPSDSLNVTGVTGTNGKTTIAYQLAQAHELLGAEAAYIGTLGQGNVSNLKTLLNTTPDALCLQQLLHDYREAGIQQVCMEVSSHALHEQRVDCIDFKQAIYTNLSHDHLDYHHTMQAYAAAKAKLFAMPTLEWAIINQDDPYAAQMDKARLSQCQILRYGLQPGADVRATNCQFGLLGSEFDVSSPHGSRHIQINGVGVFNIYNSLAVFASLLAQGYPLEETAAVMAKLNASPGRMEIVMQTPCVLVDYAHTPDALENVLLTLVHLKQQSGQTPRIWVVFGCGGDRDKTKRPEMGRIASQLADEVIITSDNPRTEEPEAIINDILKGLVSKNRVKTITDRKEAIHKALELADKQDIILIAGKGHEAYQQIGNQRFAFSDQAVVREFFS